MSPARRLVASVLVAAAIGGTTFAACRASDVTGPNFKQRQQAGISRSLVGGSLLSPGDHDSDSDLWPKAPSSHDKVTDDDAHRDEKYVSSTETVLPYSETVFNSCRNNEGPIHLKGYIKERTRIEAGPLDAMKFEYRSWKDTRGIYGTYTYSEDYYDDHDRSWKKRDRVVYYRNRESLLDKFQAGPLGLPYQTVFESKTYLQRDGGYEWGYKWQPGDDLFVYVKQVVKVDRNGIPRTYYEFRSECK